MPIVGLTILVRLQQIAYWVSGILTVSLLGIAVSILNVFSPPSQIIESRVAPDSSLISMQSQSGNVPTGSAKSFDADEMGPPAPVVFSTNTAIPVGSYIINMGVEPQSINNAIKPYGLIYTLLKGYKVPIHWAIKEGKAKDSLDFVYTDIDTTINFKGGPFIIDEVYRTAAVDSVIASWESQGVIGTTTTAEVMVPVAKTITYFMKWTLDAQNGGIAEQFIQNAGLPATSYDWTLPADLGCCDDIFVMPHADPTWADHGNLLTWTQDKAAGGCDGAIWLGCHAVSVLENVVNPADSTERLNFTMQDTSLLGGMAAVDFTIHADGSSSPYVYDHNDHPVMQFLGAIDAATKNGSEQVYLPILDWHEEISLGVVDTAQADVPGLSPGPAGVLAYGHTFGDTTRGRIMMIGGHDIGGTAPANIAAQRAFFNYSFWAVEARAVEAEIVIDNTTAEAGDTLQLDVDASGGSPPYVYTWTSECAGTFSDNTIQNPTFILDLISEITDCPITVTVEDSCGLKFTFASEVMTIVPIPTPPNAINDTAFTFTDNSILVDVLANDYDINLDPLAVSFIGDSMTSNGSFMNLGNGNVQYVPNPAFIGFDSIQYEVCDTTPVSDGGPFCDTAWVLMEVDTIDSDGCTISEDYLVIFSGYGTDQINNGYGTNFDYALGYLSGTRLATLNSNADPAMRGSILVDLRIALPPGDTIYIHATAEDTDPATFQVRSSKDSMTFLNTRNYAIPNNAQIYEFEYINNSQDSIRFIEISGTSNSDDVKLDGVRFNFKACLDQCQDPNIRLAYSGNADAVVTGTTAGNPANATGPPDNLSSDIADGEVLILDLSNILPQNTIIQLFLAHNGPVPNIQVSSSVDSVSFSNQMDYVPSRDKDLAYTPFYYPVVDTLGARYLMIQSSGATGYVDALTYRVVTCEDNTPVATDDFAITVEDFPIVHNVMLNDYDLQNELLTAGIVSGPSNGVASISDSLITYTPNADFSGSDTIYYRICDSTPLCDTAIFVIDITPDACSLGQKLKIRGTGYGLNHTFAGSVTNPDRAVGVPDGLFAVINDIGGALDIEMSTAVYRGDTIILTVQSQDVNSSDFQVATSIDGINYTDSLTMVASSGTPEEILWVVRAMGGANFIRIEKNSNTNAKDIELDAVRYPWRVCDFSECVTPYFSNQMEGYAVANDPGSTAKDPFEALGLPDQDGAEVDLGEWLKLDMDTILSPGTMLYFYLANGGTSSQIEATFSLDGMTPLDSVIFNPSYSQPTFQQFSYEVVNPQGVRYVYFDETTDRVDVDAVQFVINHCENDRPVALPDSAITLEDFGVDHNVLINDIDLQGDTLTVSIVSGPTNGNAFVNDSLINYTPDPDWNGMDTIYYRICDHKGYCDTSTLVINVFEDFCVDDPGVKLTHIGPGYGLDRTSSGSTQNRNSVIGVPDDSYATVSQEGGAIDIELSQNVFVYDSIWLFVRSEDNNPSTFEVSISNDDVTYTNNTSLTAPDATGIVLAYRVTKGTGADFIRIAKNGNTNNKDILVDAVYYKRKECIVHCNPTYEQVAEGYASSYVASHSTVDGSNATGAPDDIGVSLDGDESDYLTVDLDTLLPQGSYVYLYLADDGTNANFLITSSDTLANWTNSQSFTANRPDPNYQQFRYDITQNDGAQYIRIAMGNNEVGYVDAVGYYTVDCIIPQLILVESHADVACFEESNGSIDLSIMGGIAPFIIDWDNDGTGDKDDPEDLSGLPEGTYKVVVSDSINQVDSLVVSILEPTLLTSSVVVHNHVLCKGAADGEARVLPSGGSSPYSYLWSDASTSDTLFNAIAGWYYVTVTDNNLCETVDSVLMTEPGPLTANAEVVENVSCIGSDGSARVIPGGGTSPYSYVWSDFSTDEILQGQDPGWYSVTVTDLNGCMVEDSILIQEVIDSTLISGMVFHDVDYDGVRDATEDGVEGVLVEVYDATNMLVGQDTTSFSGRYGIAGLNPLEIYRIEFIDIPAGYSISIGPDSKSAVQFASPGDCDIHLGVYMAASYCEDDPFVLLPCYVEGEYDGSYASNPALVRVLSSADGHDFNGSNPTSGYEVEPLANHEDLGAVYGAAWQATTGMSYVSAFHKRYSGFGPYGPDAIYQIGLDGALNGVIELDSLLNAIDTTGGDVHDFTPVGGHVYDLGTGDVSFDAVGKRGYGDIEISADMNTLYAVNLWDRRIYALDVSDGVVDSVVVVNSWAGPDATGNGKNRPFGLAWHQDLLWVGSVDEDSLVAYVHSMNPSTGSFTLQLTIPLDYQRQETIGADANGNSAPANWNVWEASPDDVSYYASIANEISYPQAILSDIEFASDGDMILGFRDRFGDQAGYEKYFESSESTISTYGLSAGDLLKACENNGSYTLETGATGSCNSTRGLDDSGPGGVEFYHWDMYNFELVLWNPNVANGAFHWETTQGGLYQLNGAEYVLTTAMDPYSDFSGGILKLNNSNGGRHGVGPDSSSYSDLTGGYTIYETGDWSGFPPSNGYPGKSNGLGDLEAACMFPISIGDYVWFDENQNGIQDPGEQPLVNVGIEFYQDGVLIGMDTTDADGFYYFGGVNKENIFDTTFIRPLTSSELHISLTSAIDNDGSVLGILAASPANVQGDSLDRIDSDGVLIDSISTSVVVFTTDFLGTSTGTYDFGFMGCPVDMDTIMYAGCQGDGYFVVVGSSTYDENNTMGYDTLTNSAGCDSIVYTQLMFFPTYLDSIDYIGCEGDGYTIMVGSTTYNEGNPSGTDTLMTINGCDSIVVVDLVFNPEVVVEAGMLPGPACSNSPVVLNELSPSIGGGISTGKWTTSGTGAFDNSGDFGGTTPATIYTLSPADIQRGHVILSLTSDDPAGPCEPEADAALIIINDVECSTFPYTGN